MANKKSIFALRNARILFLIPGILLCCFFQQCRNGKKHKIHTAFYFWKTQLQISPYERSVLKDIHASTLYLRLFDVDWDDKQQKALPVGVLQSGTPSDSSLQYIPVVYITRSCLQRLQPADLPELSGHISSLISSLCIQYKLRPEEIQIDCDWTRNSAPLYFSLLKQLKRTDYFRFRLLSCTIRMHQVKFTASSGIPPVDKGLLMVYNMGNLTRYGGQNSILDADEAKAYLKHIRIYPLPLDVALPVYHWAALFEYGRFKGITYNISKSDFNETVIEQKDGNLYRILQDTVSKGYTFKKGQELRFEQPEKKALQNIASFIGSNIRDTAFRMVFFHLDSNAMQPFTAPDLRAIVNTIPGPGAKSGL